MNAFRYLLKPVTEDSVRLVMGEVRRKLEDSSQTLLIKSPKSSFPFFLTIAVHGSD